MSPARVLRVLAAVLLLAAAHPAHPAGAVAGEPAGPGLRPATDTAARLPDVETPVRTPEGGAPVPPPARDAASLPAADNAAVAPPAVRDNAAATLPGMPDNAAATPAGAGTAPLDNAAGAPEALPAEPEAGETPQATVADPLERVNRAFFVFNDKAYFWVMKPVAQGYRAVVPQDARVAVRNFFSNLGTPVRFANNLLQGKFKGAGTELLRLVINSTIGMAGFFDPAETGFHLEIRDEDLGQTFGRYGLGQGFYIVWPILGPSTARDTVGLAGDSFLDPVNYLADPWAATAVHAFKTENELSLSIGDYEDLKKSSLDPYAAVRDAYIQNREKKVRE